MHQHGVALHAANGRLNKNTDVTQGCMGSLLLSAQVSVGVLVTRARLLRWDINPITTALITAPATFGHSEWDRLTA